MGAFLIILIFCYWLDVDPTKIHELVSYLALYWALAQNSPFELTHVKDSVAGNIYIAQMMRHCGVLRLAHADAGTILDNGICSILSISSRRCWLIGLHMNVNAHYVVFALHPMFNLVTDSMALNNRQRRINSNDDVD